MDTQRIKAGVRRTFSLLLLGVLSCHTSRAANENEIELSWHQASRYLFQDAYESFRELAKTSKDASLRNVRLGEALTLLNVQPKTRGNIQESADLLSALVKENAGDEVGITAKYYLGRIEQVHRFEPDHKLASEQYRQLFDMFPQHRMAQLAFVKWGMLQIYSKISTEELQQRIETLESMSGILTDKPTLREYHMLIADAYARLLTNGEAALNHLIAAEALGFSSQRIEANTLVRIGETALQLGKPEIALPYYRKFVAQFPRDNRNYTVRQRIKKIEEKSP